jgi:hypothetical protein
MNLQDSAQLKRILLERVHTGGSLMAMTILLSGLIDASHPDPRAPTATPSPLDAIYKGVFLSNENSLADSLLDRSGSTERLSERFVTALKFAIKSYSCDSLDCSVENVWRAYQSLFEMLLKWQDEDHSPVYDAKPFLKKVKTGLEKFLKGFPADNYFYIKAAFGALRDFACYAYAQPGDASIFPKGGSGAGMSSLSQNMTDCRDRHEGKGEIGQCCSIGYTCSEVLELFNTLGKQKVSSLVSPTDSKDDTDKIKTASSLVSPPVSKDDTDKIKTAIEKLPVLEKLIFTQILIAKFPQFARTVL